MKKKFLISLITMLTLLTANLKAYSINLCDVGSFLFKRTNASSQINSSNPIDIISELNNKIEATDKNMQSSFIDLVSLLSGEEESKTVQSKLFEILNSKTTQTSKSTSISDLFNSYALGLMTNKQSVLSTISNMSSTDKSALTNVISSLAKSQNQYLNIATDYAKTATTLAKNSQNIKELANNINTIKETASILKTNAQTAGNVISQISNLAKASGLSVGL